MNAEYARLNGGSPYATLVMRENEVMQAVN